MITQSVVYMSAGDNRPVISCTLKNTSLDGYTITGRLRHQNNSVTHVTAVITDAPHGKFMLAFNSSDITVGRHELDILFAHADGSLFSVPVRAPILLKVRNAVG